MTSYNREKYIAEAIQSVLSSTFKNFELIIVDDCSFDNTPEIIKQYEQIDSRVKVYFNSKNLGDYANRNMAASYAQGKYLMHLDSDDKTFDFSFDYCVKEMEKDENVDFGILCFIPEMFGKILTPNKSIQIHFFRSQFLTIGPGGTIIKKTFFQEIGMYPEKYGPANDMYFNLKAASNGKIKCLGKEFLFYRRHKGQESNNNFKYLYNNYLYMKDALLELPMGLDHQESAFLQKKNKRRFVVNLFIFFLRTWDLKRTKIAVKNAEFSFKDGLIGLFHI